MVHGRYAEYQVLVDGECVADGGALAVLGIVPARKKVVEAIRAQLIRSDATSQPTTR